MENLLAWPEPRLALKACECSIGSCHGTVAAELDARPMCLDHFVSISAQEMDIRSACLDATPVDTVAAWSLKKFLTSCAQQAEYLTQQHEDARGGVSRTRLMEIMRRCSELGRRLRRSPRVAASFPVWLRREDERNTWEEETWTSTVSRHGAGFVCRRSVEVNGLVVVCRRDKGYRAQARVVYSHFDAEGRRQIGVELLDGENFWDVPQSGAA